MVVNTGSISGYFINKPQKALCPAYDNERSHFVVGINHETKKHKSSKITFKIYDEKIVEKINAILNYQVKSALKVECLIIYKLVSVCAWRFGRKYWFENKIITDISTAKDMREIETWGIEYDLK